MHQHNLTINALLVFKEKRQDCLIFIEIFLLKVLFSTIFFFENFRIEIK